MWKKRYRGKRLEDKAAQTEERPEEQEKKERGGFWRNYGYLLITAAVVVLVFRVLLQLAYVPTGSMETTIPTHSLLVSWQLPYLMSDPVPERGNIITFWNDEENKLLVKRVIGLPGDTVTFSDGYVLVNGEQLPEEYLDRQGVTQPARHTEYQVPEGCLLMLGDNRTGSRDSRYWNDPYVPCGNVRAQVKLCIPIRYISVGGKFDLPLPELGKTQIIG